VTDSTGCSGVPECFICGSGGLCEHREWELAPYWRRLGAMQVISSNRTPANPTRPAITEAPEVPIEPKPPATAQSVRKRETPAQGARQRSAGGKAGYSALRGW